MRTGPVKRLHPSTDLDGQWVSESSPLRIESGQHEELRVDAHTMSQAQYHHVVARDHQTDDVSSSATDCPPRLLGRQPCDTPTDVHVHILRSRAPTHPVGEAAVLRLPGACSCFRPCVIGRASVAPSPGVVRAEGGHLGASGGGSVGTTDPSVPRCCLTRTRRSGKCHASRTAINSSGPDYQYPVRATLDESNQTHGLGRVSRTHDRSHALRDPAGCERA